jgi:hypothetical protein
MRTRARRWHDGRSRHNTDDLAVTAGCLAGGACTSALRALVRFGARHNADIYERLSVDPARPGSRR